MNDKFNFKKIVASVLMMIALILIVAECDNMCMFIISKIVGGVIGYIGYIIMLNELKEEDYEC